MSKLSKHDFDEYLGKDSFYSEKDKNRFYKQLRKRNGKKNWFAPLATVMVAISMLFIGITSFKYDYSFFNFNAQQNIFGPSLNNSIQEVQTKQAVDSYYYEKTPGLKRAEKLGLVTEVNKRVEITEDASIEIDKIWYNSDDIFIFYNTSLPKETKMTERYMPPRLANLRVKPEISEKFSSQYLTLYTKNIGSREGIVYNNRFYHRIVAEPIKTQNDEEIKQIDEKVSVDISMKINENRSTVSNVEIPLQYNKESQSVYTTSINQTIENPLVDIQFNRIEIGINKNYLYGEIDSVNNHKIHEIKGKVTTDTGEDFRIFGSNRNDNKPNSFIFETQAFNSEPEEIDIEIQQVSLVGEKSFEFSLDVSDYEQKISNGSGKYEKQLHKKIDEIKQTNIFLERLYYDDRGISFGILYEPIDTNQKVHLLESTPRTPREGSRGSKLELPTEVSAVNSEGIKGEYGQRGVGGSHFSVFLTNDFVKSSQEVNVTVKNLLYKVAVNDSISFPVSFEK